MNYKVLCAFTLLVIVTLIQKEVIAGSKKVIIHVPYHIKNIKHTHTIYKIIKHQHHGGHKKSYGQLAKQPLLEDDEHYGYGYGGYH